MLEDKNIVDDHVLSNTDLAFERTILAENRTLMAWVRTGLSMISFGFTIYKFFEGISNAAGAPHKILTPRIVGMIIIALGMLGLYWGLAEYNSAVKKLKKSYPSTERSRSSVLAFFILIFGFLLFLGALFRQ